MFSKPSNPQAPSPRPEPPFEVGSRKEQGPRKSGSLIAVDLCVEGNIAGGGELQVDGTVKGDIRVDRVTIGDGGHVEGTIFAEAVEVRGRVTGAINAKQVRLFGACHVDGDITHEQLAMETGAFFQGRSQRLQRPSPEPPIAGAAAREMGVAGAPPSDSPGRREPA